MKSNNCSEWLKLIKTIYERKQMRMQTGRKETAVDSKYFKIAEDILYGELSVALDIERNQVSQYIAERLK